MDFKKKKLCLVLTVRDERKFRYLLDAIYSRQLNSYFTVLNGALTLYIIFI